MPARVVLALQLERSLREFQASQQVLPFQVRELGQHILERIARGQVFENGLDRVSQPAADRRAVTNLGINGDSGQP